MHADDRVEEMYREIAGLADEVIASVKPMKDLKEPELAYRTAQLFFFGRGYKSYQSVMQLWKSGYEEDAFVVLRGIYESFLQARFIGEEPHKRAMQYTKFDWVARYRYYKMCKSAPGYENQARSIEADERFGELKREHNSWFTQYGIDSNQGRNWWNGNIRDLAKGIEKTIKHFEGMHVQLYWEMSAIAHAGVTSVRHYIEDVDDERRWFFGPRRTDEARVLQLASLFFLELVSSAVKALDLPLKNRCDEIAAKAMKISWWRSARQES